MDQQNAFNFADVVSFSQLFTLNENSENSEDNATNAHIPCTYSSLPQLYVRCSSISCSNAQGVLSTDLVDSQDGVESQLISQPCSDICTEHTIKDVSPLLSLVASEQEFECDAGISPLAHIQGNPMTTSKPLSLTPSKISLPPSPKQGVVKNTANDVVPVALVSSARRLLERGAMALEEERGAGAGAGAGTEGAEAAAAGGGCGRCVILHHDALVETAREQQALHRGVWAAPARMDVARADVDVNVDADTAVVEGAVVSEYAELPPPLEVVEEACAEGSGVEARTAHGGEAAVARGTARIAGNRGDWPSAFCGADSPGATQHSSSAASADPTTSPVPEHKLLATVDLAARIKQEREEAGGGAARAEGEGREPSGLVEDNEDEDEDEDEEEEQSGVLGDAGSVAMLGSPLEPTTATAAAESAAHEASAMDEVGAMDGCVSTSMPPTSNEAVPHNRGGVSAAGRQGDRIVWLDMLHPSFIIEPSASHRTRGRRTYRGRPLNAPPIDGPHPRPLPTSAFSASSAAAAAASVAAVSSALSNNTRSSVARSGAARARTDSSGDGAGVVGLRDACQLRKRPCGPPRANGNGPETIADAITAGTGRTLESTSVPRAPPARTRTPVIPATTSAVSSAAELGQPVLPSAALHTHHAAWCLSTCPRACYPFGPPQLPAQLYLDVAGYLRTLITLASQPHLLAPALGVQALDHSLEHHHASAAAITRAATQGEREAPPPPVLPPLLPQVLAQSLREALHILHGLAAAGGEQPHSLDQLLSRPACVPATLHSVQCYFAQDTNVLHTMREAGARGSGVPACLRRGACAAVAQSIPHWCGDPATCVDSHVAHSVTLHIPPSAQGELGAATPSPQSVLVTGYGLHHDALVELRECVRAAETEAASTTRINSSTGSAGSAGHKTLRADTAGAVLRVSRAEALQLKQLVHARRTEAVACVAWAGDRASSPPDQCASCSCQQATADMWRVPSHHVDVATLSLHLNARVSLGGSSPTVLRVLLLSTNTHPAEAHWRQQLTRAPAPWLTPLALSSGSAVMPAPPSPSTSTSRTALNAMVRALGPARVHSRTLARLARDCATIAPLPRPPVSAAVDLRKMTASVLRAAAMRALVHTALGLDAFAQARVGWLGARVGEGLPSRGGFGAGDRVHADGRACFGAEESALLVPALSCGLPGHVYHYLAAAWAGDDAPCTGEEPIVPTTTPFLWPARSATTRSSLSSSAAPIAASAARAVPPPTEPPSTPCAGAAMGGAQAAWDWTMDAGVGVPGPWVHGRPLRVGQVFAVAPHPFTPTPGRAPHDAALPQPQPPVHTHAAPQCGPCALQSSRTNDQHDQRVHRDQHGHMCGHTCMHGFVATATAPPLRAVVVLGWTPLCPSPGAASVTANPSASGPPRATDGTPSATEAYVCVAPLRVRPVFAPAEAAAEDETVGESCAKTRVSPLPARGDGVEDVPQTGADIRNVVQASTSAARRALVLVGVRIQVSAADAPLWVPLAQLLPEPDFAPLLLPPSPSQVLPPEPPLPLLLSRVLARATQGLLRAHMSEGAAQCLFPPPQPSLRTQPPPTTTPPTTPMQWPPWVFGGSVCGQNCTEPLPPATVAVPTGSLPLSSHRMHQLAPRASCLTDPPSSLGTPLVWVPPTPSKERDRVIAASATATALRQLRACLSARVSARALAPAVEVSVAAGAAGLAGVAIGEMAIALGTTCVPVGVSSPALIGLPQGLPLATPPPNTAHSAHATHSPPAAADGSPGSPCTRAPKSHIDVLAATPAARAIRAARRHTHTAQLDELDELDELATGPQTRASPSPPWSYQRSSPVGAPTPTYDVRQAASPTWAGAARSEPAQWCRSYKGDIACTQQARRSTVEGEQRGPDAARAGYGHGTSDGYGFGGAGGKVACCEAARCGRGCSCVCACRDLHRGVAHDGHGGGDGLHGCAECGECRQRGDMDMVLDFGEGEAAGEERRAHGAHGCDRTVNRWDFSEARPGCSKVWSAVEAHVPTQVTQMRHPSRRHLSDNYGTAGGCLNTDACTTPPPSAHRRYDSAFPASVTLPQAPHASVASVATRKRRRQASPERSTMEPLWTLERPPATPATPAHTNRCEHSQWLSCMDATMPRAHRSHEIAVARGRGHTAPFAAHAASHPCRVIEVSDTLVPPPTAATTPAGTGTSALHHEWLGAREQDMLSLLYLCASLCAGVDLSHDEVYAYAACDDATPNESKNVDEGADANDNVGPGDIVVRAGVLAVDADAEVVHPSPSLPTPPTATTSHDDYSFGQTPGVSLVYQTPFLSTVACVAKAQQYFSLPLSLSHPSPAAAAAGGGASVLSLWSHQHPLQTILATAPPVGVFPQLVRLRMLAAVTWHTHSAAPPHGECTSALEPLLGAPPLVGTRAVLDALVDEELDALLPRTKPIQPAAVTRSQCTASPLTSLQAHARALAQEVGMGRFSMRTQRAGAGTGDHTRVSAMHGTFTARVLLAASHLQRLGQRASPSLAEVRPSWQHTAARAYAEAVWEHVQLHAASGGLHNAGDHGRDAWVSAPITTVAEGFSRALEQLCAEQ